LINYGNKIRKFILKHPFLCNSNTIDILSNKSKNYNEIDKKFLPLLNIINITQSLIIEYEKYSKVKLEEKNYDEVIRIFNQIYLFTNNYLYKINVAKIYLEILKNPIKSLYTYKEIENTAGNNLEFLHGIAEVYWNLKDYYNQVLYLQKAVEIEINHA
jgi:tetratricopeptide (TPR) repeat protein